MTGDEDRDRVVLDALIYGAGFYRLKSDGQIEHIDQKEVWRMHDFEANWQPIETAPRDGTEIIGHVVYEGPEYIGGAHHFVTSVYFDDAASPGWVVDHDPPQYGKVVEWMPLPESPDDTA